jgi:hypothetical protein
MNNGGRVVALRGSVDAQVGEALAISDTVDTAPASKSLTANSCHEARVSALKGSNKQVDDLGGNR